MNVRLFHALDAMERATKTSVTTINWPVDGHYEVRRDREKDKDVREYIETFLAAYKTHGLPDVNKILLNSAIHRRMILERDQFVADFIRNPEQYDGPPPSVELLSRPEFQRRHQVAVETLPNTINEVLLYNVGMTNIRSDPYTGMAILYKYLYIVEKPSRALILWFPNITTAIWHAAAARGNRKDIKLFRIAADAILFADGLLLPAAL